MLQLCTENAARCVKFARGPVDLLAVSEHEDQVGGPLGDDQKGVGLVEEGGLGVLIFLHEEGGLGVLTCLQTRGLLDLLAVSKHED